MTRNDYLICRIIAEDSLCQTYDMCIAALGVSRATIAKVVKTFCDNGIDDVLKRSRSINSDNARCKVDGCIEARLIVIARGQHRKDTADGRFAFLKMK